MQPRALEANPDVAGLGVVIGFLATAYLLVVLLVIYYIFYFDPTLDPFRPKGKTNKKAKYPNPVDIIVVRQIRKLVGRQLVLHPLPADGATEENSTRRLRYETTVNKCVLSLADIQIITGIGILISGYSSLHCGLSAYHWQTIIYLAWFSSVTHQSALTLLRNYLHNNRSQFVWRIVSMLILLIFLGIAIVPTAHFDYMLYSDMDDIVAQS